MPHLLIRYFKMHLLLQVRWGTLTALKYINDFGGNFLKNTGAGEGHRCSLVTNECWPTKVHTVGTQGTRFDHDYPDQGSNELFFNHVSCINFRCKPYVLEVDICFFWPLGFTLLYIISFVESSPCSFTPG